jgi:AbrB family looped-hinge helix DNA binding protein
MAVLANEKAPFSAIFPLCIQGAGQRGPGAVKESVLSQLGQTKFAVRLMILGEVALMDWVASHAIDVWVAPLYLAIMNTRLTLDRAGRIVIPKTLRDELRLQAGDALDLVCEGEQITLRPVRGTSPLTKERGVWVFRTGQPLSVETTDDVVRRIRDERDAENLDG